MPRDKSRYRERRSSSSSSESSYERRKKSKHKRRSRSRDRDRSESSSHRRKRSTSRSRHKRRSYSRSLSRDRYEKARKRSTSRSKSRRDRSHSRSHSRSRSKYSKSSKKYRRRSRSLSSRSNTPEGKPYQNVTKVKQDDTDIKIEKAIKAAEAAGLTLTKIPTYEYKEVDIKEDMPTIHDRNLLEELNSDTFVQKTFTSSSKKKDTKNIIIDLEDDTIKVPAMEGIVQDENSIINLAEIPDEKELMEMWIKKLYQFRKRTLKGEI